MTDDPRPATPEEARDFYGIAVEMADRVSARRGQANQFYLSLQTLLLGAPVLVQVVNPNGLVSTTNTLALATIGCLISVAWWLQLKSYRDLNRAKFEVINELEARYFEVRPFTDEWTSLKKDPIKRWRRRYAELGSVERVVPVAFLILNFLIAVSVFVCLI